MCVFEFYVNGIALYFTHDSFSSMPWLFYLNFFFSYMLMHRVTVHFFLVLHSISSYKLTTTEPCGECQEANTSVRWNVLGSTYEACQSSWRDLHSEMSMTYKFRKCMLIVLSFTLIFKKSVDASFMYIMWSIFIIFSWP